MVRDNSFDVLGPNHDTLARLEAPSGIQQFAFTPDVSSVLRALGLPAHGLLLSLLGFNQGVEVGQGLVVAAGLPLLFLLRGTRWESRAGLSSSLAILVLGLVLLVERALL